MNPPPLDGICVIDLTHDWAGPHCTRLLADYGAEVILVEYPRRLGLFRGGITEDRAYDRQPFWFQVNRNKYGITLDLKRPKDHEIFRELAAGADVVAENGRTGVMERLGLGYAELSRINPSLIMLSMPAYGGTGPDAAFPAYGGVLEAVSGIQNLTAYADGGACQRIREMDVVNGVGGACAVMTALVHRQRTGRGQHIDFSQLEFITHALIGEHLLEFAANGTCPRGLGNRHRCFAPQGCYPCLGEDKWVTLTVRSQGQWERLCDVLGHSEWRHDPRFASNPARQENHDQLDREIEAWTRPRTHVEAMQRLQEQGIPAGAVFNVQELGADPHLAARGYFADQVSGTDKPLPGLCVRLSDGKGRVQRRGPNLGEHNEQIIGGRLGRPAADLPRLSEDEVGTAYDPE